MTDRQVMQQALKAMETNKYTVAELAPHKVVMKFNDAITALREALEQPKQEPVAFYHPRTGFYWAKPTSIFAPTVVDVEPMPLYAAPPTAAQPAPAAQRTWVGLTDEEIESEISDGFARGLDDGNVSNRAVIRYVRVIEASLKERNT